MIDTLFQQWAGEPCQLKTLMPASGSNRRYFRMVGATHRCVATVNDDVRENEAFVALARHFKQHGLPVPEVYLFAQDHKCYLQQDLGDTTLYGYAYDRKRAGHGFDDTMMSLYKRVLAHLLQFQTAGESLDYSVCYPRAAFDRQSMQWDLNYFKYFFLKLAHVPFDEQLLEDDFQRLMDYLLDDDYSFFLYRDFQGRNIMLDEHQNMSFIDFQGGRRGPLQYDVASLLYSSKSDLPDVVRAELLQYYIDIALPVIVAHGGTADTFRQRYYAFALLRIMQAMGAYGYRGYFERKDYFLKSIPLAGNNVRRIIDGHPLGVELPHLMKVLRDLCDSTLVLGVEPDSVPSGRLKVRVCSFSYRNGIPSDESGNGGGHVFDCRALPNPGRYPEYRTMTGMDAPVVEFMRQHHEVDDFLDSVQKIVFQSVEQYMSRHFSNLMVSFGCTGGQHRSVYCAERMAERLRKAFDCDIVLQHVQQQVCREF